MVVVVMMMMHKFHVVAILLLGKWYERPILTEKKAGWPQNWSAGFGREKNHLLLQGSEP
jgi:hypothetical protein